MPGAGPLRTGRDSFPVIRLRPFERLFRGDAVVIRTGNVHPIPYEIFRQPQIDGWLVLRSTTSFSITLLRCLVIYLIFLRLA